MLQDVIRDVFDFIVEIDLVPGILHGSPVLLGRASQAAVPLQEEGLDGSPELFEFRLRGQVFGIFGNKPGAHALPDVRLYLIRVEDRILADLDDFPFLDRPGRFGIDAGDLDFPALAGIGGFGSGLENPDRPELFVYSFH